MSKTPYDAYYPDTRKALDAANGRIAELEQRDNEWQTTVENEHTRLVEWREQALADRKRIVELEATEVTLAALRKGIDDGLNIEDYDDEDRIRQIADIRWRWLRDASELEKLRSSLD